MSEIYYFPRYSQAENFATNNTLLLLLRLHQYNRLKFQNFIEKLCANRDDIQLSTSWLHFQQQKGTGKSVLDGFISQDSIKIAVETKLSDSFDLEQLERHLAIFKSEKHKLLLLLSPTLGSVDSQIASFRSHALKDNIQILHTSFEDILEKTRSCLSEHEEEMLALADDYESFCSDLGLLPRDKHMIFVPPCGQSIDDNLRFSLYYCPTSWSRRKTKYLGLYADKAVRAIGRIAKVVSCEVDLAADRATSKDSGSSLSADEERRILGATESARKHTWDLSAGHKFYLLDELVDTEFRKVSSGGIMGHRYFDLQEVAGAKVPDNTTEVAALLRKRTWQ